MGSGVLRLVEGAVDMGELSASSKFAGVIGRLLLPPPNNTLSASWLRRKELRSSTWTFSVTMDSAMTSTGWCFSSAKMRRIGLASLAKLLGAAFSNSPPTVLATK